MSESPLSGEGEGEGRAPRDQRGAGVGAQVALRGCCSQSPWDPTGAEWDGSHAQECPSSSPLAAGGVRGHRRVGRVLPLALQGGILASGA